MKDYTRYDYEALVSRMTDILKDKEGWGDAYQSSTGQTLIQLMADVTDHLHYMLERRTLESFLDSAKLRSSVVARASELGYRPARIKSHSGSLEITMIDEEGDPVPVDEVAGSSAMRKVNFDGRSFYVSEPAYVLPGTTSAILKIKEGTLKVKTFNLDAGEEPLFPSYDNIEEDVIFVYNNGVEYKDVRKANDVNKRALSFLAADETYFDIKYGVEGMRIVFGDDNFGKKPTGIISVHYVEVPQLGDTILSTGNVFEFADAPSTTEYPQISLINVTPIVGGSEPEGIDEIRKNAPDYHRSNGRAVTNEDYMYWMRESGIADIVDAKCYGEEEFDSIIYNANNVYMTYATSTGDKLTPEEKNSVYSYFNQIKTSQAHIVLNQANNVMLRLEVDAVRNKNVPISIAQAYSIIYNFLVEYTKIKKDSIGGNFQLSDLVNAMYDLKYNRHGVVYDLIDYVKITSDVVVPFQFPAKTSEAFVEIDASYIPNMGDEFVLVLDNLVCKSIVQDGENIKDILIGMRDVIKQITPLEVLVQLSGIALDAFGNPIPVEIDPKVGYHLLIGVDTPYLSNDQLVAPAVVGSSIIGVVASSPELEINHYYYSSPAGRRPMIPLRIGTDINFTAPSDTNVNVYIRTDAKNPATETYFGEILAGDSFVETFNEEHVLIFEYVNDSSEDVIVNIKYPEYAGAKFGLLIKALDNFGKFSVVTSSGDLSPVVSVDYRIQLPVGDYFATNQNTTVVRAGTLRLTDSTGSVLYQDNGNGRFVDGSGNIITSGSIDYVTGLLTLPKALPAVLPEKEYLVIYDQNRFENVSVGSAEVIKLIEPPASPESSTFSLSSLRVS